MLRLKLEFVPFGLESQARQIGLVEIWNDGTGTLEVGNYKARLTKLDVPNVRRKTCKIKAFPRTERDAWDLALLVLSKILK